MYMCMYTYIIIKQMRFLKKICLYLFFGCDVSSLLCVSSLWLQRAGTAHHGGAQASRPGGFSCCGAPAPGAWASGVVMHRLSCSAACGILLDRGLNPYTRHQQANS